MGEIELHPAFQKRNDAAAYRAIMDAFDPLEDALDTQVIEADRKPMITNWMLSCGLEEIVSRL